MRIERNTPRTGVARRTRLTAVVCGLLAAGSLAIPSTTAHAEPGATDSELAAASDSVREADVAGTAWVVDKTSSALVVTVDSTVTEADIAEIKRAAGANAEALRFERTPGKLQKLQSYVSGGDAIYAPHWRCSLGFNVRTGIGGKYYLLTAGHCTEGYPPWYANSVRTVSIGPTAGTSFPGNDYGIVRHANPNLKGPGWVDGQDITYAGDPYVGQYIKRRGSTTGIRSGRVTALNATVNYGNGDIVYGLIQTTACAEPGDSGGPLYAGTKALGLTSGGSGNCTAGGTTYFQPVTEALRKYGVSVY